MKKSFLFVALGVLAFMMASCGENAPVNPNSDNGALKKAFIVDEDGTEVQFAQGNLQYNPALKTWRFAEHQWEVMGENNTHISEAGYNGWIDLFGWGTGDAPTRHILDESNYPSFVDWGRNAISNGGNKAYMWRTLSVDEWFHLFFERNGADTLFAFGSVNDVNGLILLPENWVLPAGATFVPSTKKGLVRNKNQYDNAKGDNFAHNRYSIAEWDVMEQAGAVFLPTAGNRWKNEDLEVIVEYVNERGQYWMSDPADDDDEVIYARELTFRDNMISPSYRINRSVGQSVRLVKER